MSAYYRYASDSTGDLKPEGDTNGPFDTLLEAQEVDAERVFELQKEGREVVVLQLVRRLTLRMDVQYVDEKDSPFKRRGVG